VIALAKKKKKKKQQKPVMPKGIMTAAQVYAEMQRLCDAIETAVLITLNKEFGFGAKRKQRFMDAFHREMHAYLMEQERQRMKQQAKL
jgi:hypothetical protein